MKARALMVAGTASHVGKSWMATAICRWLARQGYSVAPFKAQNMSNNSFPCTGGGEIGRAQVAQAQACFLQPEPDMNPILLKPTSNMGSQVVVNGKVWQSMSAREYYSHFPFLLTQVLDAYERLAARHELVVMEGAGSISELNLKGTDLVNLGLATRLNVPVLLVADIDRGGIFASLVGTFALLEQTERSLVRSFAVNRFRGDPALFADGVGMIEARTQRPCAGVFPYLSNTPLDPEDGVAFDIARPLVSDIAIIALPHISNLSDFRLLPEARRITRPTPEAFATIILPGTKNTIGDLVWLRQTGLADWILDQHRQSARIIGICGGYQMMGERVEDPFALESNLGDAEGLGLLPGKTVLAAQKQVRCVQAVTPSGIRFDAYEIHLGGTSRPCGSEPFAMLPDDVPDGVRWGRCVGTYLHGAIEHPQVLGELLGRAVPDLPTREATFESLADWFDANVNCKLFEELYLCQ